MSASCCVSPNSNSSIAKGAWSSAASLAAHFSAVKSDPLSGCKRPQKRRSCSMQIHKMCSTESSRSTLPTFSPFGHAFLHRESKTVGECTAPSSDAFSIKGGVDHRPLPGEERASPVRRDSASSLSTRVSCVRADLGSRGWPIGTLMREFPAIGRTPQP
jgi:hypothetical protein